MKRPVFGAALAALVMVWVQSATAQPAAGDEPSPRQRELAHELVVATGESANLGASMHQMMAQIIDSSRKASGAAAQEKLSLFEDAQTHIFETLAPKIVQIVQDGYARTYSEQELAALVDFYKSPTGRELVARKPELLRNMMAQLVALIPEVRRQLGQEICAKTPCTAAQKAAFFGPPAAH